MAPSFLPLSVIRNLYGDLSPEWRDTFAAMKKTAINDESE